MAKRTGTKIKQMTPEKVAARRTATRLKAVNDIGATIGLPEIQRRPDDVEIRTVEQLGAAARTTDRTLRKLTRVEKLRNAGVLEAHEAAACEYYADAAALAWDTIGCTANYEGMGGGNYVGATARAHDVNHRIAAARDEYTFITKAVPDQCRTIFEAVIYQNSAIAAVAGERFSTLGRSQREQKTRAIVKLCANLVHGVVASRLPIDSAPMRIIERAPEVVPAPPVRVVDKIDAEIALKPETTTILMSEDVLAAMMRELGWVVAPAVYQGLAVVMRPSWSWAWILQ